MKLRVLLSRSLIRRWSIVEPSHWTLKSPHVISCCVLIQARSSPVWGRCQQSSHRLLILVSRLSNTLLSLLTALFCWWRARRFPRDALLHKLFLITVINEIYDVVWCSNEAAARLKTRVKSERIPLPFLLLSPSFFLLFLLFLFLSLLCLLRPYRILSNVFDSQLPFQLSNRLSFACSVWCNRPLGVNLSETLLLQRLRRLEFIFAIISAL